MMFLVLTVVVGCAGHFAGSDPGGWPMSRQNGGMLLAARMSLPSFLPSILPWLGVVVDWFQNGEIN